MECITTSETCGHYYGLMLTWINTSLTCRDYFGLTLHSVIFCDWTNGKVNFSETLSNLVSVIWLFLISLSREKDLFCRYLIRFHFYIWLFPTVAFDQIPNLVSAIRNLEFIENLNLDVRPGQIHAYISLWPIAMLDGYIISKLIIKSLRKL